MQIVQTDTGHCPEITGINLGRGGDGNICFAAKAFTCDLIALKGVSAHLSKTYDAVAETGFRHQIHQAVEEQTFGSDHCYVQLPVSEGFDQGSSVICC